MCILNHKLAAETGLLKSSPHPDMFWYRLNGMGVQKCAKKSFSNKFSINVLRKI